MEATMKTGTALLLIFAVIAVWELGIESKIRDTQATPSADAYVITAYTHLSGSENAYQPDQYTIVHGNDVLTVRYSESQTASYPAGKNPEDLMEGIEIHYCFSYPSPDLSRVPSVGVPVRVCEMDTKYPDKEGHPVIAIQSVESPCIERDGTSLHYEPAPNTDVFTHVSFEIESERTKQ
jgi:hypothetical protein